MYTVFAFGEVFFIFEGAAFSIPGWLVALVALLLFEAALSSAPIAGLIVIALFYMLAAMMEQINLKAWYDGVKDKTPGYIKYIKMLCSIVMNLICFMYSAGGFLVNGVIEQGSMFIGTGWLEPMLSLFIIAQAARLVMHLVAAIFSWIFKWAGVIVSNIAGILAYTAGAGVFVYFFFFWDNVGFAFLERLCYGISIILGGGVL